MELVKGLRGKAIIFAGKPYARVSIALLLLAIAAIAGGADANTGP